MVKRRPSSRESRQSSGGDGRRATVGLRIVGGRFRGRRLVYSGDFRVRPMKDRVREAVFNLLGSTVVGKHAIDLFAGTGALGLESLSRGAVRATLLEMHTPTAAIIRQNVATLDVASQAELVVADTFRWWRRRPELGSMPWLVFCCPPYAFFDERKEEMLELIRTMLDAAPHDSLFVVESDERFDFALLPDPSAWDVRRYLPAFVGIYQKATTG